MSSTKLSGNLLGHVLAGLQANRNLQTSQLSLQLRNNDFGHKDAQCFEASLRSLVSLGLLDLSENTFDGDEGLFGLLDALERHQSINTLILNKVFSKSSLAHKKGASGASVLKKLLTIKGLAVLKLADNGLKQAAASLLEDYASGDFPIDALHTLDISGNHLSDAGAVSVAKAIYNTDKLRELVLRDSGFSVTGWNIIAQVLKQNRSICVLDVPANEYAALVKSDGQSAEAVFERIASIVYKNSIASKFVRNRKSSISGEVSGKLSFQQSVPLVQREAIESLSMRLKRAVKDLEARNVTNLSHVESNGRLLRSIDVSFKEISQYATLMDQMGYTLEDAMSKFAKVHGDQAELLASNLSQSSLLELETVKTRLFENYVEHMPHVSGSQSAPKEKIIEHLNKIFSLTSPAGFEKDRIYGLFLNAITAESKGLVLESFQSLMIVYRDIVFEKICKDLQFHIDNVHARLEELDSNVEELTSPRKSVLDNLESARVDMSSLTQTQELVKSKPLDHVASLSKPVRKARARTATPRRVDSLAAETIPEAAEEAVPTAEEEEIERRKAIAKRVSMAGGAAMLPMGGLVLRKVEAAPQPAATEIASKPSSAESAQIAEEPQRRPSFSRTASDVYAGVLDGYSTEPGSPTTRKSTTGTDSPAAPGRPSIDGKLDAPAPPRRQSIDTKKPVASQSDSQPVSSSPVAEKRKSAIMPPVNKAEARKSAIMPPVANTEEVKVDEQTDSGSPPVPKRTLASIAVDEPKHAEQQIRSARPSQPKPALMAELVQTQEPLKPEAPVTTSQEEPSPKIPRRSKPEPFVQEQPQPVPTPKKASPDIVQELLKTPLKAEAITEQPKTSAKAEAITEQPKEVSPKSPEVSTAKAQVAQPQEPPKVPTSAKPPLASETEKEDEAQKEAQKVARAQMKSALASMLQNPNTNPHLTKKEPVVHEQAQVSPTFSAPVTQVPAAQAVQEVKVVPVVAAPVVAAVAAPAQTSPASPTSHEDKKKKKEKKGFFSGLFKKKKAGEESEDGGNDTDTSAVSETPVTPAPVTLAEPVKEPEPVVVPAPEPAPVVEESQGTKGLKNGIKLPFGEPGMSRKLLPTGDPDSPAAKLRSVMGGSGNNLDAAGNESPFQQPKLKPVAARQPIVEPELSSSPFAGQSKLRATTMGSTGSNLDQDSSDNDGSTSQPSTFQAARLKPTQTNAGKTNKAAQVNLESIVGRDRSNSKLNAPLVARDRSDSKPSAPVIGRDRSDSKLAGEGRERSDSDSQQKVKLKPTGGRSLFPASEPSDDGNSTDTSAHSGVPVKLRSNAEHTAHGLSVEQSDESTSAQDLKALLRKTATNNQSTMLLNEVIDAEGLWQKPHDEWLKKKLEETDLKLQNGQDHTLVELISDGVSLLELVEVLTADTTLFPKYKKNASLPVHKLDNLSVLVSHVRDKIGLQGIANVTGEDLFNGEPKKILVFMNALEKKFA